MNLLYFWLIISHRLNLLSSVEYKDVAQFPKLQIGIWLTLSFNFTSRLVESAALPEQLALLTSELQF